MRNRLPYGSDSVSNGRTSLIATADNGSRYVPVPMVRINGMKITLAISDDLLAELKKQAIRERRTLSSLVEESIRNNLSQRRRRRRLRPLRSFDTGHARVNVSDRNALERAMGVA